ncbi:hypothetical protein [Ciceribacter sp. RN22]|uniref:hypothetical protein n=1 Tax=Ciceribacter sp. RN22 TaxID=2954932 RepID=UPI0020940055|nr:hypothetical protein [Ciceribacter sp. RN22]MCO6180803.1 hypothetical protein [Ciceribacter sp. RN22]
MRKEIAPIIAGWVSSRMFDRLEQKARATEAMLRQRSSAQLRAAEVDLVFAHYLYGLVTSVMGDASPEFRLGMVRHLGGLVLPVEAVTAALHTVPPTGEGACARMLPVAEQAGRRDGDAIREMDDPAASEPIEPGTAPVHVADEGRRSLGVAG